MVRRAHANGDIYLGTYEGWYCPNEGFRNATDVQETARGTICPNHPDVPLQWLTERNWFFRLSAYQERLERHFADHPDFVQPDYRRNEMLGFIRGGLEDFSISRERTPGDWGIPFPIAENGETALREDGTLGSRGRQDLRLVRRPDQLHHRRRLPGRPDGFAHWWPADLHVIGKDIARFHTIFWPAMLWSAGLEAPRQGLGPRLAAGGRRRADEQEPRQLPRPERLRGGLRLRRRPLRRAARGAVRPRRRGELGLVRPPLQRRPRQRLRQPRQPDGLDDEPLPRRRAARAARPAEARRSAGGSAPATLGRVPRAARGAACCTTHWPSSGSSSARPTSSSTPRSRGSWPRPAKAGDEAAGERLRGVLGDLLEACRLRGPGRRAVHAGHGAARPGPARLRLSVRRRRQRRPADPRRARLGRPRRRAGRVRAPEPLFPRLEVEADATEPPA